MSGKIGDDDAQTLAEVGAQRLPHPPGDTSTVQEQQGMSVACSEALHMHRQVLSKVSAMRPIVSIARSS